jgi:hypothetical protein
MTAHGETPIGQQAIYVIYLRKDDNDNNNNNNKNNNNNNNNNNIT